MYYTYLVPMFIVRFSPLFFLIFYGCLSFSLRPGMLNSPLQVLASDRVALIEAFYPGMEGARAIAEAIFGTSNRWGKLP